MDPHADGPAGREMNLRYAGTCTVCGEEIAKGAPAVYSPVSRSVHHIACSSLDRGTAGGSARREHERRQARDEARVDAQRQNVRAVLGDGFIGRVATFLTVDDSPRQSTAAWAQGAAGEERVAARLDALAEVGVVGAS